MNKFHHSLSTGRAYGINTILKLIAPILAIHIVNPVPIKRCFWTKRPWRSRCLRNEAKEPNTSCGGGFALLPDLRSFCHTASGVSSPLSAGGVVQHFQSIPIPHIQILSGVDRLARVKEFGNYTKADLAKFCSYVLTKKDSSEQANFTSFYEALLEAKGLTLSINGIGGVGKGGESSATRLWCREMGTFCSVNGFWMNKKYCNLIFNLNSFLCIIKTPMVLAWLRCFKYNGLPWPYHVYQCRLFLPRVTGFSAG